MRIACKTSSRPQDQKSNVKGQMMVKIEDTCGYELFHHKSAQVLTRGRNARGFVAPFAYRPIDAHDTAWQH